MRKSIFLLLATAFLISYAEPDEIVLVQEKPIKDNSTIMLNKHNFIPYIAPLVLQNTDLEQSQYVFATDVTAGRSVDSGRTSGNVTVKEGTEYEIEASGDVTLAGGFEVELGARFTVQRTSYK